MLRSGRKRKSSTVADCGNLELAHGRSVAKSRGCAEFARIVGTTAGEGTLCRMDDSYGARLLWTLLVLLSWMSDCQARLPVQCNERGSAESCQMKQRDEI